MHANPSHMNRPSPHPRSEFTLSVSIAWKDAVLGCSLSEAIPKRCLRRIYHCQFTPAEARVNQHRTGNHLKRNCSPLPRIPWLAASSKFSCNSLIWQQRPNPSCPNASFSEYVTAYPKPAPITLRVIGLPCNCVKIFGYSGNNDHRLGERKIVRDGQINLRGHPLRDERCQPRPGATHQGHRRFS